MPTEIALKIDNLSKYYKLYTSPVDRLKESLHPLRRQYHHDFYALKNVSFEVNKGESVGVIGKNGSGKSTLLKILTGVLTPTSGTVQVCGKVSALLELGAGFNPEMSGLENVYFNGMLMGYKRDEIEEKLDAILSFADIGEFVNQPVKTYSSGMFVRLAFALAVNVEPDILIVDEALSVGDIFFQQKCYAAIRNKIESGITMLFVSHDSAAVMNLCKRTLLLEKGSKTFDGPAIEGFSRFIATTDERKNILPFAKPIEGQATQQDESSHIVMHNILGGSEERHGAGGAEIIAVNVMDQLGNNCMTVSVQEAITIQILVKALREISDPNVGLHLFDRFGNLVFACGTRNIRVQLPDIPQYQDLLLSFKLSLNVQPGEYTFSVGISEPSVHGPNVGFVLERLDMLGPLSVVPSPLEVQPFGGIAQLPLEVSEIVLLNQTVEIT